MPADGQFPPVRRLTLAALTILLYVGIAATLSGCNGPLQGASVAASTRVHDRTSGADPRRGADAARAAPGLSVRPASGRRAAASALARYDFRRVSMLDKATVETRFVLASRSGTPLVLDRFETSCGCTTAVIDGAAQPPAGAGPAPGAPAATLAPGTRTVVRVAVDLARVRPGRFVETVSAYIRGFGLPSATMEVAGVLVPSVAVSPSRADFGRVPAGQSRSVVLTAAFDTRLTAAGPLPQPACSNPYVRISALPPSVSPGRQQRQGGRGDRARFARSYRVELAPQAPLGPVTGLVVFARGRPPAAPTIPPTPAERTIDAALRHGTVPLGGGVSGEVAAVPETLSLGTPPLGRASSWTVELQGTRQAALDKLAVFSATPWLSARLEAVDPRSTRRRMTVTLSPQAPRTILQTELMVLLPDHRRLIVPVSGTIGSDEACAECTRD